MSIFTGTTELANVYVGSTEIADIYVGTTNVWTTTVAEGRLYTYTSEDGKIKEIDVNTKTVINSSEANYGSNDVYGLGGLGSSRLFRKTFDTTTGAELDINTLLPIANITFPVTTHGIEGTYTRLYIGGTSLVYEIDPITFTLIKTSPNSRTLNGRDIGCINNRLYSISDSSSNVNIVQEFDTLTLTLINSANAPSGANTTNRGIGGVNRRLFTTDSTTDLIYELDINTMAVIATTAFLNGFGIGGTKTYSS